MWVRLSLSPYTEVSWSICMPVSLLLLYSYFRQDPDKILINSSNAKMEKTVFNFSISVLKLNSDSMIGIGFTIVLSRDHCKCEAINHDQLSMLGNQLRMDMKNDHLKQKITYASLICHRIVSTKQESVNQTKTARNTEVILLTSALVYFKYRQNN